MPVLNPDHKCTFKFLHNVDNNNYFRRCPICGRTQLVSRWPKSWYKEGILKKGEY